MSRALGPPRVVIRDADERRIDRRLKPGVKRRIQSGDGDPRHGTATGYQNWGCRCEECRTALRLKRNGGQMGNTAPVGLDGFRRSERSEFLIAVPCWKCGAQKGEPCRTEKDARVPPHKVRGSAVNVPVRPGPVINRRWDACDCGRRKYKTAANCRVCAGELRQGAANRFWKGGRTKNGDGYIQVKKPEHPNARKTGYVFEHTLVMSEIIGRPLTKNESVHHRNGVRDDNQPENLELWTVPQREGVRSTDALLDALAVVRLYAPQWLVGGDDD